MSFGRIEKMVEGEKEYVEYANKGGGSASEYVYIENFIKTETLLNKWEKGIGSNNIISAKMYDSVTGKYLKKNVYYDSDYVVQYVPLSFGVIPYYKVDYDWYAPVSKLVMNSSDFAYLGVAIDLTHGTFNFRNLKTLSENPFMTWYKAYSLGMSVTESDLKARFQTMIFRGFLKKLDSNNPMYLGKNSKNLDDAVSSF